MDVRPIRTETDYDWALTELEVHFCHEPEPGSPAGDRFEVLATLVEAYEKERWSIPICDPVEILAYAISDMGHTQSELAALLGSRSRASEILTRKRPLSLEMIRRISNAWDLPPALLMPRYNLVEAAA